MSKLRPQVMLIILVLGVVATYGLYEGMTEIASGVIGGMIAISKDLINTDD